MPSRRHRSPPTQAQRPRERHPGGHQSVWLYGRHPVLAALANPERRIERILATREVADRQHRSQSQIARLGLEMIGVVLPPVARPGNPQWVRRDG